MTRDYYNDFDPGAAAWLRELMKAGHIPAGQVDDRSILDVAATDLVGFRRCHFFAGIAGWAEALRLSGWPDTIPVWTGSPPCQPFSAAGKRGGRDDARHLGPRFVEMVRSGRPPVLFGEQVASADAIGRAAKPRKRGTGSEPAWAWWDDLSLRLEAAGYAAWAAVVPAAAVGAPHIRERLFFAAVDLRFAAEGLAHAEGARRADGPAQHGSGRSLPDQRSEILGVGDRVPPGSLADPDDARLEGRGQPGCGRAAERSAGARGVAGGLADAHGRQCDGLADGEGRQRDGTQAGWVEGDGQSAARQHLGGLADADGRNARAERQQCGGEHGQQPQDGGSGRVADHARGGWREERADGRGRDAGDCPEGLAAGSGAGCGNSGVADQFDGGCEFESSGGPSGILSAEAGPTAQGRKPCALRAGVCGGQPSPTNGFWGTADWLLCRDERWRPAQSSLQRVADGVPAELVRSGAFVPASSPLAAPQKGIDRNAPGARRVMRLRGYGNAIVPQAAAEFIDASREILIETGIWAALEQAFDKEASA